MKTTEVNKKLSADVVSAYLRASLVTGIIEAVEEKTNIPCR